MFRHQANTNPISSVKSQQPDKILFDIAMKDLDKGKYTVARLNLQTLLNTYPNSEYLAQAKLALANSWYREGGAEGYAQAEAQYRDFITFFPLMKEASEAQLRIAQIHYNQLQKPDRDSTQALRAQSDLRTFLLNYPDSPLRPQALQMLRATQEVLAEGEFRIGQYYLDRAHQGDYPDYRAAQNRFEETLRRYPLYSRGDLVTDELAHSYATTSKLYADAAKLQKSGEQKELMQANANSDHAKSVAEYQRLVSRYPLSPFAKEAKTALAAMHAPVPTPSATEIAFNRDEIAGREKAVDPTGWDGWFGVKSMLSGKPASEIARADKVGSPSLAAAPAPPPQALPGLQALIHHTLIASGVIPADPPAVPAKAAGDKGAVATASTAPANTAPLVFQSVTTAPTNPNSQERGADTLPTSTPQAMTGNNFADPNATPMAEIANSNIVLTPNELDMEKREQTLAADVHRQVPPPLAELKKGLAAQEKQRAKLLDSIQKIEKEREKQGKPSSGGKATPKPQTAASSGH